MLKTSNVKGMFDLLWLCNLRRWKSSLRRNSFEIKATELLFEIRSQPQFLGGIVIKWNLQCKFSWTFLLLFFQTSIDCFCSLRLFIWICLANSSGCFYTFSNFNCQMFRKSVLNFDIYLNWKSHSEAHKPKKVVMWKFHGKLKLFSNPMSIMQNCWKKDFNFKGTELIQEKKTFILFQNI